MFARFKRKHDDDEEPLVPHGLIWQATGEPADTDEESRVAKTPALEDNQVSPQVVEMPASPKAQPQADPPRKLGAISPPLQWPSPNIQEIARHPDIHAARPTAFPVDQQPKKKAQGPVDAPAAKATVHPAVVHSPAPKLTLVARKRTASWMQAGSARVRSALSFCGSQTPAVSAEALRALAAFRTGLRERFQRVNVKARFVNARGLAGAQIESWRQKSQSLGAAAAENLTEWRRAAALRSRSGIQKSVVTVKAIDFGAAARRLQRVRNLKVTIRIPHQDFTRIATAISAVKAPWDQARQAVNRDSRLWTSMAMAGVSALLALGFVSALNRYQPDGSPNVVAAHSPDLATSTGHAELTSIPPVAPNAVALTTVQRPGPAVRKQKDAAIKHTNASAAKPVRPAATIPSPTKRPSGKTHHSEDDDYVARDTYVLYGSNGKPLRH